MNAVEKRTSPDVVGELVYLTYDKSFNIPIALELVKVGYRVKFTSSLGETLLCLRQHEYPALIVGPFVPANDKALIVSELRRRGSETKIVLLYRDGVPSSTNADAMFDIQNGVETITQSLRTLLQLTSEEDC